MTDEASKRPARVKIENLQLRNEEAIGRLARLGAEVSNVDSSRDKFFIKWLFENLLSEEAQELFTIAWEEEFGRQLHALEGQAREQQLAITRAKLGAPPPGTIILPGGVRRSRS